MNPLLAAQFFDPGTLFGILGPLAIFFAMLVAAWGAHKQQTAKNWRESAEAYKSQVDAYKGHIEVLTGQVKEQTQRALETDLRLLELEKEVSRLRALPDMTVVVKTQDQLLRAMHRLEKRLPPQEK